MNQKIFDYHYGHLPEVKKKISHVLKQLGLKPTKRSMTVEKFLHDERRFYMPTLINPVTGKKHFFKARLQDTDEVWHTGIKEINFHRTIKTYTRRFRSLVVIPEYQKSGIHKNGFIWFLREYLDGAFAGTMDLDFGYQKKFLEIITPQKLAAAIEFVQKLTPRLHGQVKIGYHGWGWYEGDFNFYRNKQSLQQILAPEILQAEEIFENHQELLEKNSRVATHGDLYPNNLLITPEKNLAIFDWELVHHNNLAFDPGFIWMMAWRSRSWQQRFLRIVYRQQKDKKLFKALFRLVVLSLCFRLIRHCRLARTRGYHHQMKVNGYSPEEINKIPLRAEAALQHHLRVLKKTLNYPDKFFS